jgi:hypothetical protein
MIKLGQLLKEIEVVRPSILSPIIKNPNMGEDKIMKLLKPILNKIQEDGINIDNYIYERTSTIDDFVEFAPQDIIEIVLYNEDSYSMISISNYGEDVWDEIDNGDSRSEYEQIIPGVYYAEASY